jgi:hypothetical protein
MEQFKNKPMYTYLMVLVICASAGLQGWMALFTNFAKEVVGVNGFQIGVAQTVREIPGFLTFLVMYVLLIMREHRLSAWSVVMLGIGIGAPTKSSALWKVSMLPLKSRSSARQRRALTKSPVVHAL